MHADIREVLQHEFRYDFRKDPPEISARTVFTVFTCIIAFNTVILQIFGVVLFSVFSVVNGFTEIKKTPKFEKRIERSRQHPRTPKFKRNRKLRDRSLPKF